MYHRNWCFVNVLLKASLKRNCKNKSSITIHWLNVTQYLQIWQCFYKHFLQRIQHTESVAIKSNSVNGSKDTSLINKWMSLSILLTSLIIRTIIFDKFNMFYDFSRLGAWEDYSQNPHTNQLKLLSESMEQTPRLSLIRDTKLNCKIR